VKEKKKRREREREREGERGAKGGLTAVNATGWHYAACLARPSMHRTHILRCRPMMTVRCNIVISFLHRTRAWR